jgi:hypothetical protein
MTRTRQISGPVSTSSGLDSDLASSHFRPGSLNDFANLRCAAAPGRVDPEAGPRAKLTPIREATGGHSRAGALAATHPRRADGSQVHPEFAVGWDAEYRPESLPIGATGSAHRSMFQLGDVGAVQR